MPRKNNVESDEFFAANKDISEKERKITRTSFYLLLPSLLIAVIAIAETNNLLVAFIVMGVALLQFLMIKNFIEDYYAK